MKFMGKARRLLLALTKGTREGLADELTKSSLSHPFPFTNSKALSSFAELRLHGEALILFPVVSPSVVPREQAAWFDDDRDPVWLFLRVLEPPLPLLSPILCRYLPQELPLVLLHDPGFPFDDDRPVRPLVRGDAYGNTAILGHCLSFHA